MDRYTLKKNISESSTPSYVERGGGGLAESTLIGRYFYHKNIFIPYHQIMAMIESYDFGRIVIDGRTYTRDVLIFPDRVLGSWWRKEGHSLSVEDLKEVLEFGPKTLVIGTGRSGLLKVKDETRERLESEGIEVIVESTGKACDVLNSLGPNAAGAFHLTC